MQAYFDYDDAQLEFETLVTRSTPTAGATSNSLKNDTVYRRLMGSFAVTLVLCALAYVLTAHLGSAACPEVTEQVRKPAHQAGFVVEIPQAIKPKPKPKETPPPPKIEKPKPVERLRSVPDRRTDVSRQLAERKTREVKSAPSDRSVNKEQLSRRAMPAVQTPMVDVKEETLNREEATESLRYAAVDAAADTIGGFADAVTESYSRNLPEEAISHIDLDPYHYQMVNLCLRLCVKSMFTHSGISQEEKDASAGWLKIVRGDNDYFSIKYGGEWMRFDVYRNQLSDISNLNFVHFPGFGGSSDAGNSMLEEVTRKLCSLLGYDDCFSKL